MQWHQAVAASWMAVDHQPVPLTPGRMGPWTHAAYARSWLCHQHDTTGTGIHQTTQCFSTLQLSSVGRISTGAAPSCFYLIGVEPGVVVCYNSPSVTRINELCALRCGSVHHCCTALLFVCLWPAVLFRRRSSTMIGWFWFVASFWGNTRHLCS